MMVILIQRSIEGVETTGTCHQNFKQMINASIFSFIATKVELTSVSSKTTYKRIMFDTQHVGHFSPKGMWDIT